MIFNKYQFITYIYIIIFEKIQKKIKTLIDKFLIYYNLIGYSYYLSENCMRNVELSGPIAFSIRMSCQDVFSTLNDLK